MLSGLEEGGAPRIDVAAGGALTALSEFATEWDEVVLKARAVSDAFFDEVDAGDARAAASPTREEAVRAR